MNGGTGDTPALIDTSAQAMSNWLSLAGARGYLAAHNARAYQSASDRVLALTGHPLTVDMRTLDVEATLVQFLRAATPAMSRTAQRQHMSRFRSAVRHFLKWVDGGPVWPPTRHASQTARALPAPPTVRWLTVPVPLRGGQLIATAHVPPDLTPAEAAHIERVLMAYAVTPPAPAP